MQRLLASLIMTLGLALAPSALQAQGDPPAVQAAEVGQKDTLRALIAAAVKEGSLSYWDTIIQSKTNAALVDAFRKYYGLPDGFTVNYSLTTTTGMVTRVEQEIGAGRVTMDIGAVASLPWVYEKIGAGHIMRYESPQYRFYKSVLDKGLGKSGYYVFNGAYVFVPMWNTEKQDFKGGSWNDVLGKIPEGRISIGDASKSQSYLATYMGQRQVLPVEYFKKLAAMKPVFLVRSEQIAAQLVTGQNLMAFSGMPTRAFQANARGAKLKFILPKEGVVLLPQAMFILAKAPHPSAAKLWFDFMLSEVGQKIIVDHEALMSGRGGFKSPLPDYAPAIDSLNVIKTDWEKMSTADMQKAREEWMSIFNP